MRKGVLLIALTVLLASCESKNFGSLDYIREDLKDFCSKRKIIEERSDGKVVFQFADPETDRRFSIFIRPEGDPVEEIYLLWNRKYGSDNEEGAFKCAFNYVVAHLCKADFKALVKASGIADEIEASNEAGKEKKVSDYFGECFIYFVSRGRGSLSFLVAEP